MDFESGGSPNLGQGSNRSGGGRRDSGITLLSLLQNLSDLLTDENQTQADFETVGARVASLLPTLIEEFCERESAPQKKEILSICKLTKLAITQFPSIFGKDLDLSVYWVIRYFLNLCKLCDTFESVQAVVTVFDALVDYAREREDLARSLVAATMAAVKEVADHVANLLRSEKRGGLASPLIVRAFREAFQTLDRGAGLGEDGDRDQALVFMDRGDIRNGLSLTIATVAQGACSAKVLLRVLAYALDRYDRGSLAFDADSLVKTIVGLFLRFDGLLPHCCEALAALVRFTGTQSYTWSWVYEAMLEKTCRVVESSIQQASAWFHDPSFDREVAALLVMLHRSTPTDLRSKGIARWVVCLCARCCCGGGMIGTHPKICEAACELLWDACLPPAGSLSAQFCPNGEDLGELAACIETTAAVATDSGLIENLMELLLRESERRHFVRRKAEEERGGGSWLGIEDNGGTRKRATSTSTSADPQSKKPRRPAAFSYAEVLDSDRPLVSRDSPSTELASVESLKKFCLEAEAIANSKERVHHLGVLVLGLVLGKRGPLDGSVRERLERSVWHVLSLCESDLKSRKRSDEASHATTLLRITAPFASTSFLPKAPATQKSKSGSLTTIILAPWNAQDSSVDSKLGAIKLGAAASWQIGGCKQLLEVSLQDKEETVKVAAMTAAPILVGRPHCSQLSQTFVQMARDPSKGVRIAVGYSLAAAYLLDFDLKDHERMEILARVKGSIGRDRQSGVLPDLQACFHRVVRRRESARLKSKNYFDLKQWGLVAKLLLFSEQEIEVQTCCLQSLGLIFASCHPKEVAGASDFLVELMEWILSKNRNDEEHQRQFSRMGKFHSVCEDILRHLVSKAFLQEMFPNSKTGPDWSFLQHMRSILQKSANQSPAAQQLALAAISSVGTALSSQDSLLIALVLLVGYLDNRNWNIKATAARGLKRIAGAHGTSLASLISQNPRTLEYIGRNLVNKPRLAGEAADVLFGCDEKSLIVYTMPFVLPTLIELKDTKALEALALAVQATSLSEMLLEYGYHAMAEIFVVGGEMEEFINYMERLTGWDFTQQLDASLHNLLIQVLWKASDVDVTWRDFAIPQDVLKKLKDTLSAIAQVVQKLQPPSEALPAGNADGFVLQSEHISMILKAVSDHLKKGPSSARQTHQVTSLSPNKEVQAIRCLNIMIELSGHHVREFTPGFLALLTKGLEAEDEEARIHSVQGFTYFVDALAAADPAQLKRIVEPIVVALLPFLEIAGASPNMHDAVIRLMERLVIKYQAEVQTKLRRFPLLPSTPDLAKVNEAIQKSKGRMDESSHLRAIIESLDHDAISVKYSALGELKSFLVLQQEWINKLINSVEDRDKSLVNDLLHALFKCSRANLKTIKCPLDFSLRCLECLGEVGAVDPRKCRLSIAMEQSLVAGMKSKKSLASGVVATKLAKVLSSTTDLDALDATAYAIQQILRYYGGHPTPTQETRHRSATQSVLWNELSEDVQGVIRPLLKSKYQMTNKKNEKAQAVPIIGSGILGLTYERWLLLWIRHLISCVPKDHELKRLFEAVSGMLKYDLSTMLFLLPYLILVVVTCGSSSAVGSIKSELNAAVSQGACLEGSLKQHKQDGTDDESFYTLSMQTIFSLLDQFSNWLEMTKHVVNRKVSTLELNKYLQSLSIPTTAKSADRVSLLLTAVPQIDLARAAYHCGAHARALKHYEMHLRNAKKCHGLNTPAYESKFDIGDDDLSFLIETYSHLEEPDGIGGLIKMRKETRLSDKTLAAEKAGNWSEVLSIYEEALQDISMQESQDFQDIKANPTAAAASDDERGYLRCLLNMGHHQALITHISGLTAQFQDKPRMQELSSYAIASALRLGRWSLLNELRDLSDPVSARASGLDFDVQVATLLQEIPTPITANASDSGKGREDRFKAKLELVRKDLLGPLSASSMESYLRVYPVLRRLQVLQEVEHAHSLLSGSNSRKPELSLRSLEKRLGWRERLERTQPNLTTREPIMAVRRAIISFWIPKAEAMAATDRTKARVLKDQARYIGTHFLEYAKLCRKAGYHEAAHIAILKAESKHEDIDASLSKAKLLWDMDKKLEAISELKASLNPRGGANTANSPRMTAKKTLHLANWSSLTGHEQETNLMRLYEQAILYDPEWEKGYFFFARYLDDLMRDAQRRERIATATGDTSSRSSLHTMRASRLKHFAQPKQPYEYVPLVLKNYGECIQHGTKTIYQSMPRMLTVWFEFGHEMDRMDKTRKPIPKEVTIKVSELMLTILKKVPQAVWLTALPQLISRICHPHPDVLKFTKHILSRTLHAYPDQVLWHLATVANSNVPQRRKGAKEVIQAARKRANEDKRQLFLQFERLIDELIRLCHHSPSGKAKTFSISQNFRTLERMMPLDILVPVQNALTLALPPNGDPFPNDDKGAQGGHRGGKRGGKGGTAPFEMGSSTNVTISRIFDEVEILSSLQKPKVIKVLGSDGNEYRFLCKPKDDLRKDTRMMEFANVLNHLLATKSHHLGNASRHLYIRTFAVMPLTEDCGMIEWIENTRGFRHCCQDVYIQDNMFDRRTNKQIKETYDAYFRNQSASIKQARESGYHAKLLDKILSRFPPKLHKWFLQHFPEPSMWFESRLKFSRSCAVWSVCGHVVGLGDRHGENVLIDSSTGDCVHVDFSCLFDKGLSLEKPEVVPFRLTQNMIDAMGVSGYEGVFRKSCETTLEVLRSNKETLLNVLETFVHDPLVEWTSTGHVSVSMTSAHHLGQGDNTYAREAMANIESRLSGVVVGVNANPSLPLSVEGQADRLIAEATSKENLGMMYIWWMPWF